jgi:TolA-binding protein
MAKISFNIDLKKLSQESLKSVDQLSKQFAAYEKRLKTLVHDMDVQTRDARKQGRDRLDRFLDELRGRRDVLEKRVTELVSTESKRIHEGVNELVTYLKVLRANGAASSGSPRPAKATKSAGSRSKTGGKKKASSAKKAAPSGGRSPRRKAPVDAASTPVM